MFDWEKIKYFELRWRYKSWFIEKWFQTEFMKKLTSLNFINYHIPDVWFSNKFLDLFFVDKKWFTRFIEFKKIMKDTFNVSQFEEWQVILLKELDQRNINSARVWIYSTKHNEYVLLTFSEIWKNKNEKWWIKLFWKNKYENN